MFLKFNFLFKIFIFSIFLNSCTFLQTFKSNESNAKKDLETLNKINQDNEKLSIKKVELKPLEASKFGNPKSYIVYGKKYTVKATSKDFKEEGFAVIYSDNNQKLSSGEYYNKNIPSASSNILPLPSYAKIYNLENGKSVIVKINDRGPFFKDEIYNKIYITKLSHAAAFSLGINKENFKKSKIKIVAIKPFTNLHFYKVIKNYYIVIYNANSYTFISNIINFISQSLTTNIIKCKDNITLKLKDLNAVCIGPIEDEKKSFKISKMLNKYMHLNTNVISVDKKL